MSVIPTSFNPSDYEFLLKSVAEGNHISKAESLKRFNTLVRTDKKQFGIYAKRIVLGIQDLLTQPKEDINLLACTLTLEIINLNPKDIQFYIRTKLLKNMVRNLGDSKPQIRKTSHYCLLGYVKTYKTFDEIIQIYLHYGLHSESWQLRQKSINSFQSILMLEMKYLNWSSPEFRKIFEELLKKTKDENPYVQKAAELCLLSVCKADELRNFSKKLPSSTYFAIKEFCEKMKELGHLQETNLYVPEKSQHAMVKNTSFATNPPSESPSKHLNNSGPSMLVLEKINLKHTEPQNVSKQALINRIEEIRKKAQTPVKQSHEEKSLPPPPPPQQLKKAESTVTMTKKKVQVTIPKIRKSMEMIPSEKKHEPLIYEQRTIPKTIEKSEATLGRKLIDDLRNEKDWKIRLEAIEELQSKFTGDKDTNQLETLAKTFLPTLIKLLADSNFKVALIALKIIEEILKIDTINASTIIPQLVDKITDGKIALRQNISKLIRNEYHRTSNRMWINELLNQLKKSPAPNSNIKEEIVNNLSKIFSETFENEDKDKMYILSSMMENIVESICPLMEDLKTKIKIKTLDLLVLISVKTQKIEAIKTILSAKLNQVYFEMYMEKMAKELKNNGFFENDRGYTAEKKYHRNERNSVLTNKRYSKSMFLLDVDAGNTTSTSLKKEYSQNLDEHNNTVRTSAFIQKKSEGDDRERQFDEDSASLRPTRKDVKDESPKKPILKSFRKKNFEFKSTQYSAVSTNLPSLPPFNDPEKELKLILLEIKSDEWQTCSQSLTKLRRVIENHSEIISQPVIRILLPEIMKLVESLRSNLSKNAVITLNEISNKLKKMLDPELDSIFAKLIKKTLDTNSFISEEVKKSLASVCSNCNEGRVVTLLTNSHTSRAIPIKLAILNVLEAIAFLPKFYEKELERIVAILVDFLGEGSLEIREKAKSLLSSILCSEKGAIAAKMIPNEHLAKLRKREETKDMFERKHENPEDHEKNIQMEESGKKKKKEKITVFPQQFNEIEGLLENCESSDWKMREQSMTIIAQTLFDPYPREICQHRLSGRIMDVLSKQISDPNIKVATNALRILHTLPPRIPELIEHNLSVLINEVFNCFGSHKYEIKQLSEELFTIISNNIEKWMLIQHMCNGALYGLQKSRPVILNCLKQIIPEVYAKGNKKTIFQKNLYPMINKLVEENKPENMETLGQIMRICDNETNGEFRNSLKPKSMQFFSSL